MATEKHPNQNVNMPMHKSAVDAARARAATVSVGSPTLEPASGNGSRREVRPGEWLDDRRIVIDGPASPSKDSPPELGKSGRAVPASFDPLKVYEVTLAKGVVFAGRMLSPGKTYMMVGAACTTITAANMVDAIEIGDVPVDPDEQPS